MNDIDWNSFERQKIAELEMFIQQMDAAVNPINAEIDASRGNLFADNSPLFLSIESHYQQFLHRLAQLAPAAHELELHGHPHLAQSVQAQKEDVEKASAIIRQIVASRHATNQKIQGIQHETAQVINKTLQDVNEKWRIAYGMTEKPK